MKTEKKSDVSKPVSGDSTMSNFFRNGSIEGRMEIYKNAASAAVLEQKEIIKSAKSSAPKSTWKVTREG